MSQRGRARCHGAADRHKHISCVCCLKEPEKESGTEGEVWGGGRRGETKDEERKPQCQIGKHLSSLISHNY